MSLLPERTVTIPGVWAEDAIVDIPQDPVPGISYRRTTLSSTAVGEGWPFKEIVDSANLNQALYANTYLQKQQEEYGFMIWSSYTNYKAGGVCLGLDGVLYQAIVDNVAQNPSTSTGIWRKFSLGLSQSIGTIFYAMRTDTPGGTLPCDGQIYERSVYTDFYDEYLSNGKILTKTFAQYEADLQNNKGNCAYFGIDTATQRFRTPTISDVFLKASNQNPALFTAESVGSHTHGVRVSTDGSKLGANTNNSYLARGFTNYSSPWSYYNNNGVNNVLVTPNTNVGTKTQPDNIAYRAFVVVYTGVELSTQQAEAFVETVNNIYKELGNVNAWLDRINGEVY